MERPVGRTTLTAARTAVASAAVGAGDRRAKSRTQGLEVLPRCLARTGFQSRVPLLAAAPTATMSGRESRTSRPSWSFRLPVGDENFVGVLGPFDRELLLVASLLVVIGRAGQAVVPAP